MILQPRPFRARSWWTKFALGLVPGIAALAAISIGGKLFVMRDQFERATLQKQVNALPQIAELAGAARVIDDATATTNAAIAQHNLAVASVNLLSRIASQLPEGVHFISYTPSTNAIVLEGTTQDALAVSTANLVKSGTLDITNPSNQPGSKTIYPNATLDWASPSPSPVPAPSTSASPGATTVPSPAATASPSVSP